MSHTSAEALRTTMVVVQTGSKLARSACGTKRKVRSAMRWETAGVATPPAAASAPAPTIDLRNTLRRIAPASRSEEPADPPRRPSITVLPDHSLAPTGAGASVWAAIAGELANCHTGIADARPRTRTRHGQGRPDLPPQDAAALCRHQDDVDGGRAL